MEARCYADRVEIALDSAYNASAGTTKRVSILTVVLVVWNSLWDLLSVPE